MVLSSHCGFFLCRCPRCSRICFPTGAHKEHPVTSRALSFCGSQGKSCCMQLDFASPTSMRDSSQHCRLLTSASHASMRPMPDLGFK